MLILADSRLMAGHSPLQESADARLSAAMTDVSQHCASHGGRQRVCEADARADPY
jgi:hypothetical protein